MVATFQFHNLTTYMHEQETNVLSQVLILHSKMIYIKYTEEQFKQRIQVGKVWPSIMPHSCSADARSTSSYCTYQSKQEKNRIVPEKVQAIGFSDCSETSV